MTARTPDWLVERLHAGELPPAEAEAVRARLAAEEGGPARLEALRADDRGFAEVHPPGPALGEIRRRAAGSAVPMRRTIRTWLPATVLAAAAAAVLAVRVHPRGRAVPSGPAGVVLEGGQERTKGGPALLVHRQRAGARSERLADGATAGAGDVLQLAYVAADARYGVVLSIDGRGTVSRHFPEDGEVAGALEGGGVIPLPHAYQLDDAPEFERFFLVTGPAPFEVAPVMEAARYLAASGRARTGRLTLPAGLAQGDVTVGKGAR